MGRLIDADALLEQIENPYTEYPVMIKIRKAIADMINETPTVSQRVESVDAEQIANAPTIDAVPVVRCKDCRFHRGEYSLGKGHFDMPTEDDGFCSWGKEKMSDRLISTEALMKRINCYPGIRDAVAKELQYVPTVDAEPVRHGHWITKEEAEERDKIWLWGSCSVCGHCDWDCVESEDFNYCPNCGAIMDEKENTDG